MRLLLTAGLLSAGCSGDEGGEDPVAGDPVCDGFFQEAEGVQDGPWDEDGDGYYDDGDDDCRANYGANRLDCDDGDNSINPGVREVECNGIDDDCNEDTPDEVDHDFDGVPSCSDCDDSNPTRSPLADETCWDGIDNNCDGLTDEGCGPDYNGVFALSEKIQYGCAIGLVNVNFDQVGLIWIPPNASMYSVTGAQPGTMNGTINSDGSFEVTHEVVFGMPGYCDEFYSMTGEFLDANRFEATFEINFSGGFACLGCSGPQTFEVTGNKVLYP